MSRLRVLCVDDSLETTEMLSALIASQPDLEVAGTLSGVDSIVEEVKRRRADVVVLDLTMPGPPVLGAIRALQEQVPACRIVAFSGYSDPSIQGAAQRAGAREVVSKSGKIEDLLSAIRRVAAPKR